MTTDATLKKTVRVQPLGDRVVLRPTEEAEQTRGGLHIPAIAKEKPQRGEVVAVGPGRYEEGERVPMELSAGQTVLYDKYSGSMVTLDEEKYLIIQESEVLAIVGE